MKPLDAFRRARKSIRYVDVSYFFAAVVAVQVGDGFTTYVGIYYLGLGELNPVMETVLARSGFPGLLATKLCWFGVVISGALMVDDSLLMVKYCFLAYLLISGPALVVNVAIIGLFLL